MSSSETKRGLAVLVGAGPGDPALVTVAGAKWLSQAEVVLYDRLGATGLLHLCRADAELIYVGKRPDAHAMAQDQINQLLVEKTKQGHLVVRLKGGDSLIFGRGGEEACALSAEGLPFRIVPGITAAIAAGAYAGIPLTDRRAASTVTFITGHEDPTKAESTINYEALAGLDTLVFYMGVGNLPQIAERLIASGRDPGTPVALVQNATHPTQRTITATLATAAKAAKDNNVRPPALTIVGEVVGLREGIAWRHQLPLIGRTILVTRTRRQSSKLAAQLVELGAHVIECPTIDIRPPEDFAEVDAALGALGEFDWVVLTSPNGAGALIDRMAALGLDARALAGLKIAAVGPATADVLRSRFIEPDLMPEKFTTESLGEALAGGGLADGKRFLLARADIATNALPDVLGAAGADVRDVAFYRTVRPDDLPADALAALDEGRADWITFTSSSTVENFLALLEGRDVSLEAVKLASIGPVTTQTLTDHGLSPAVEAEKHTIGGLIEAIVGA